MQTTLTKPGTEVFLACGHLNASNASQLQNQLTELMTAPWCDGLVVDMSHVESLDSAGLMVLVAVLSLAQRLDKCFSLRAVSASIRIIFELTQLDRVFEIAVA
ncbi:hypothetical protein BST81_08690 [Leptolyngbya sp. 'hensonii']|uniref:STAS domain-containing protein n=1 Tax=Leptolyngbya sp. 'hensonii' TaxID=1922337 RepID=UPI00094FADB5|nr:STAS domain-containing protein [Leptolyngbya sp. 'hensonii']OLP18806.1 hypothetical protein BST81_08690 [Leptolyngbya sp. 'hensonii']